MLIYLFLKTEIYNYIEIKRQPIALRREMLIYSVPLIATVVGWWVNSCADNGKYDIQKLLETIDRYITPELKNLNWGYDLPMYVCGTKHAHVDNVYHLNKEYTCTANEMYDIVETLSSQQRTRYGTGYSKTDFSILDRAYEIYKEGNK